MITPTKRRNVPVVAESECDADGGVVNVQWDWFPF